MGTPHQSQLLHAWEMRPMSEFTAGNMSGTHTLERGRAAANAPHNLYLRDSKHSLVPPSCRSHTNRLGALGTPWVYSRQHPQRRLCFSSCFTEEAGSPRDVKKSHGTRGQGIRREAERLGAMPRGNTRARAGVGPGLCTGPGRATSCLQLGDTGLCRVCCLCC